MLVETATWSPSSGWEPAMPLPDGRPSLVLVFGAPLRSPSDRHVDDDDFLELLHPVADPLRELARRWADHAVLGCSSPGSIVDATSPHVAVTAAVVRFEHSGVRPVHVDVARSGGPRSAGRAIADELAGPELRAVIAFGDAHAVHGEAFAAGFAERLPGVPLMGGLAGDIDTRTEGWVLVDGERRSGWVGAVGLSGPYLELGFGSAGGWDLFGPERLVTQSYGNVLYELDGKPALPLYREYLGALGDELPEAAVSFPMSVRDLEDRTVIRSVCSVNPATESLRFAADVPQGAVAQLMRASTDRLVHGANLAARQARVGGEELAIAISCVGRRRVLGDRCDEELDAVAEALDPAVRIVGFYSLASWSPAIGGSDLHNETMTIATLREHARTVHS